MANKPEHDLVGVLFGAAAAVITSQAKDAGEALQAAAAGALGGLAGSRLPDTLEPPTHPGHRSLFHGVAANGAAAYFGTKPLVKWRLRTTDPNGDRDPAARLVSAFAVGAATGHASHILLDSTTPKGLPWIA